MKAHKLKKTQKPKLLQNSKLKLIAYKTKKNLNWDKILLKAWQIKKNSKFDKIQQLKLWKNNNHYPELKYEYILNGTLHQKKKILKIMEKKSKCYKE